MIKTILYKFLKFGAVGFSGVLVDYGITYICKEWFKVQKYLANALGFMVAASTNYYLNRIWTFHSQNPEILEEYGKFIFISLIGLGMNTLVLWYLVSKHKMNFYVSKLFAIGVVTVWNFGANYLYTFT